MPLFEVFIPTADPDGFNITARIRADSWIQALRAGLSRLGDTTDVRNVMCDITESGIDVTEPNSGRVFRIRELPDVAAPPAAPPPPAAPVAAPVAAAPPPVAIAAPPPAAVVRGPPPAAPVVRAAPPPAPRPVAPPRVAPEPAPVAAPPAAPPPAPVAPQPKAPPARNPATTTGRFQALVEEEVVTEEKAAAPSPPIGRAKETSRSVEDILGELFEATQGLYDHGDLRDAARFILELAHRSIPSDSGAVFIADIDQQDLYFAAATGPKASEVMKFRVPMGKGIVGFSAQEGVSLAVSDVHKDPRFYAAISQALGYETRSIVCAPATQEGRVFAAIELINKKSGSSFTSEEVNVLNYLAHEFADYLITTGQTGA